MIKHIPKESEVKADITKNEKMKKDETRSVTK